MTAPTKPTAVETLNRAEEIAPTPYDPAEVTRDAWLRHYVVLGLAAHCAFRDCLPALSGAVPDPGSRPDLGYLMEIAVAATAAAIAIDTPPDEVARRLWTLTPEAGALNGEFVEWLTERCDELGINPADVDHHLLANNFNSPIRCS